MADVETSADPGPETFTCDVCFKKYNLKQHLYRHKRSSHGLTVSFPGSAKCTETGCSFSCAKIVDLHSHIQEMHRKKPSACVMTFSTFQDFLDWKSKEESDANVMYVQNRGKRVLHCGSTRLIYYCNRSGQYKCKGSGKKKNKKQGTCKIGIKCTSMMVVTLKTNQTVEVMYYKGHSGHSMDLEHVRISEEDRCRIAEKLAEGVSMDAILDDVRDTDNHGNKLTRLQLLKRKDLHNIKKEFGLAKQEERHPTDAIIVQPCAKSMSTAENSPLLLNKPQVAPFGKLDERNLVIAITTPAQQEVMLQLGLQVNNNVTADPRPIRPSCSSEANTSSTETFLGPQNEKQETCVVVMCTPDMLAKERPVSPSVKRRLHNLDVRVAAKGDIANTCKTKICVEQAKQHVDHQYTNATHDTDLSETPVKKIRKSYVGDLTEKDFSTIARAKTTLENVKLHVDEQCQKVAMLQKNKEELEVQLQKLQESLSSVKKKPAVTESLLKEVELTLPATAAELVKRSVFKEQSRESYAPELRSFAMTLNGYSSDAYEYLRRTFNGSLPSRSTLFNWSWETS